ncbi:unnamed protein product [Dracunculus medinensis]|uniref:P/Homo B domain-containing protein n=1 Tax=Dracunculus medinensis TaxID=318479 RepID=A0A158Q3P9_DRAME|nr:unnamed protein product [Dracunculus medinensis]
MLNKVGIRILGRKVTDRLEAEALLFNNNHIDIYSASWGPNDDGRTVDGPRRLSQIALMNGIKFGRQGKGSIFVWASGNGGLNNDDCSCDGYSSSIYTFSVASATENGNLPWYGEKCASILATTFSTGSSAERMIVTTDTGNKCTMDHSGTSASAPVAAAVIALGLEANPLLTWRDAQHIAIWTAQPHYLISNYGWRKNGIGLYFNPRFGFGMMNAFHFANVSKYWKNVPEQQTCTTNFPSFAKRGSLLSGSFRRRDLFPYMQIVDCILEVPMSAASIAEKVMFITETIINFETDACQGRENEINIMEHVNLILDMDYPIRGHLAIYLISPQSTLPFQHVVCKKTRSQLLSLRRQDYSSKGFREWPFMSVHFWGENPRGIWQLEIADQSMLTIGLHGFVNNISLIIYGTKYQPEYQKYPKNYVNLFDKKIFDLEKQMRTANSSKLLQSILQIAKNKTLLSSKSYGELSNTIIERYK